ncbi:MAG TPA: ECF-type sigma factor [Thermoanaerobaculia bacterium]|nr:ECF-type sigma factor [Thermoanaerobaculia bacterium]
MSERSKAITLLLHRAAEGDRASLEELTAAVYAELERTAAARLRARYGPELAGSTLEPAALVNETLLRVIDPPRDFENRRHFYAFATKVMLNVLRDYQRRRGADKRGGGQVRLTLGALDRHAPPESTPVELEAHLDALERLDPRKAEVVRLRVFWGMENQEMADTLGVSRATVERDWSFAKAWLSSRLDAAVDDR